MFIKVNFYSEKNIPTHSAESSSSSAIEYLDILFREFWGPELAQRGKS